MAKAKVVDGYARMWPRTIFERSDFPDEHRKSALAREIAFLEGGGVYVLYRDDEPYYIGQADRLVWRLWAHARQTNDPYFHFWNFFSAFAIQSKTQRNEVEGILIASMPTVNGAKPRLVREPIPKEVAKLLRAAYSSSSR